MKESFASEYVRSRIEKDDFTREEEKKQEMVEEKMIKQKAIVKQQFEDLKIKWKKGKVTEDAKEPVENLISQIEDLKMINSLSEELGM